MKGRRVGARADEGRASLYEEITSKIIGELEAGRVPWVQPWGTQATKAQLASAVLGNQRPDPLGGGD